MQKRLFVAISIPEDIKKRLFRFVEKEFGDLPVKWVRRDNFHLTINFLGYAAEENIPQICEAIRQSTETLQTFDLEFQKTEIGPNCLKKKMIWITGEVSRELAAMKHSLDIALGFFAGEKKEFRPHINLGRIKKGEWKNIKPEPEIEKNFKFSLPVSSVELYESKFEKGKRVYYILESFSLKS